MATTLLVSLRRTWLDVVGLQRWRSGLGLLAGPASVALWLWLAFLRPMGAFGAVIACLGVAVVCTAAGAYGARNSRSQLLLLQYARGARAFTLLLLFIPEYLGRVPPPLLRSALLFTAVWALWLTLSNDWFGSAARSHQTSLRRIPWPMTTALIFFVGVTFLAIRKYLVFGYVGQDLAYFAQIMRTTLRGHLFWGSLLQDLLYSKTVTTDFAGHNSPIMFLMLPFYAAFPTPVTLLILRNLAIASCVVPVYFIARHYAAEQYARLWAVAFLFVPVIFFQTSFDFYPLSFVALPLLCTLFYYLRRRYLPFFVWMILTLLVREDLALFAIALALIAMFQRRSSRWVLSPLIAGLAWGALSYLVVLPHALHGASFVTDACFSHLGHTPSEMLNQVCSSPRTTIFPRGNIVYLKQLLTPTALLLPFGSALVFTSLPFLAINLLAGPGRCITTVIFAQYSVVPAVILFVSALVSSSGNGSLARLSRLGFSNARVPPLVILSLSLGTLVFVTGKTQADELREQPWTAEARTVAGLIPANASVAAPRYMLPTLSNRDCLYQTHRLAQYHGAVYEYLILDAEWSHINAAADYESAYRALLHDAPLDPAFHVIYRSPAFTVLQNPAAHDHGCFPEGSR